MRVLIFVEDPGAANVAARLPSSLAARGARAVMVAAEPGAAQLRRLGVEFEPARAECAPELGAYDPDLLVVGTSENPDSRAFALIEAARKRGIPSAGLVDSASSAAYRFRGRTDRPLEYAPDWLIVPDEQTASAYSELGFPGDRMLVAGHPHYDRARAMGATLAKEGKAAVRRHVMPEAPTDRQVLTFVAEPSVGLSPADFLRNDAYQLTGWGNSVRRTDIVLEEILLALDSMASRPYFVLRLHPKEKPQDYASYLSQVDWVSHAEPALEVVFASDAVVGLASSLLIEAAYLGVPSLSVLPRDSERAWLGTAGRAVPCVFNRADIASGLAAVLKGRGPDKALLDRLYPCGATERIASFLVMQPGRAGAPAQSVSS